MKKELRIHPSGDKGRVFSAFCLGYISCDYVWDAGSSEDIRPTWAVFANSESELKPFVANLMIGKKADFENRGYSRRKSGAQMEFMKSAGYSQITQRTSYGALTTFYLPDLFLMDPGMVDPKGAQFLLMPTKAWCAEQQVSFKEQDLAALAVLNPELSPEEIQDLAPTAYLFAAYLDRRIRFPILADPRFYMQVMLACLREGLACFGVEEAPSYSRRSSEFGVHFHFQLEALGMEDLGYQKPIGFSANHNEIGRVLSEQVKRFKEHF